MKLNEVNKEKILNYKNVVNRMYEVEDEKSNSCNLFKTLKNTKDMIEKDISNKLSVEYNKYYSCLFIEAIAKALTNCNRKLENIYDIMTFNTFTDMFSWDKEKVKLFNSMSTFTQKKSFIEAHYNNGIYVEVENFKFVIF
jgi:hypothetical protein